MTKDERARPLEAAMAKQIKIELAEREMTQAQLAQKIGIGRVVMSRYLNGHSTFDYPHLIDIADTFGVDLSELIHRAEARLR